MNILSVVLCIISIILNIITLYNIHNIKKMFSDTNTVSIKKHSKSENKKVLDNEYMYSLEFNTELDGLIQPKLDDGNLIDIINFVYETIMKRYNVEDPSELKSYITDIMRNYVINENTGELKNKSTEFEVPDFSNNKVDQEPVNLNSTILPLEDFYK